MSSDPTTIISLDYLIELSDDGNHPSEHKAEELIIPPVPQSVGTIPAPASTAQPVPDAK
jgi:hypothetical protein